MAKTAERHATYEDVLKAPEDRIAELIDGEIYTSPRPAPRHMRAAGSLYADLRRSFDGGSGGPSGWWIVIEEEIHLGSEVFVPDLAGWRRERVPELPVDTYWDVAPDWICEVISPSTGALDRVRKMPAYAAHDVSYAWLLDPLQKSLEVFRLVDGHWSLVSAHVGDEIVCAEPCEEMELRLASLW